MVRVSLAAALAAVLACPVSSSGLQAAGFGPRNQRLEFDVASIKRNPSDRPTPGSTPPFAPGQLTLTWIPARFLATRAFPSLTTPIVVEGLPAWADSEHYDVVVKFRPDATAQEQAEMWKTLLADRLKLQAHYETRTRPAYRLVLARPDRRLGAQLKPSTLDCPPPDPAVRYETPVEVRDVMLATLRDRRAATPQEETVLLSQCRGTFNAWNTIYSGSVDIRGLIQSLSLFGRLDRPILDETGLEGRYSVKLWATTAVTAPLSAAPAAAGPSLDDAPSLFSAIENQLGLKLEPATTEGTVLVVDHIERPTEN